MVRIAVLVSGGGTNLQALIDAQNRGEIQGGAIAAVISSSPDAFAFVSPDCDGGPIILQRAIPIEEGDTPELLQRRVMEQAEWKILPQAVGLFCQGRLHVEGRIVHISPA